MNSQSYERAKNYVYHRLERELSPHLSYHGLKHTRDDVVPSAEVLAGMEGISGEALDLLLTAAWFHDIGFIDQPVNHEKIGARIAAEVLPGFGYTPAEVEIVQGAIFATILPQRPTTCLEQIMADADLNVLGRTDFGQRSLDLRREQAYFGREYTDIEWFRQQLKFIETHAYFTDSACALLNPQKLLNIAALEQLIASLTP